MKFDYKIIHIGEIIKIRVAETDIKIERICKFMNRTEDEINEMYQSESIDSDVLLRWSKLLEYDFFRLYSQHLILYSPPSKVDKPQEKKIMLPTFRKSIYTREVIDFIVELIETQEKTMAQIIKEYKIPKSTLHRWTKKYNQTNTDQNE
ncbi:transposase [Chryseobacterium sp. Leaf405]|uniref:transposase n=1 Tax=Chryseobacterium sp. Leaf405 TaxID=1736367 RepID=UPI0006F72B8C|nr:transposase [Chryseobacterium sp. Leaf405]KQT35904.1 transposase [Chryseobacterium sp. Leaf405]